MIEGEPSPFSGSSYADFTPQKAKEVVAKISPAMRGKLTERVRQALQFHHEEGHAEAARFCIVVLDALRNSSLDDAAASATMLDALSDELIG